MKKYSALLTALVLGLFTLATITPLRAAGGADAQPPKEISKEEAVKKYPPANGKSYPEAISTSTTTGGFFQSPYSSKVFDCRKVKKGAYLLDDSVNKVFLRP